MKGICFIKPLFPKVADGYKTMTRRIIKPQPDDRGLRTANVFEDWHGNEYKPRYKVGEIVYLKEPYNNEIDGYLGVGYWYIPSNIKQLNATVKPKNKLFMPQKYARYFIKINGVRVERLQDISEEDCLDEGITFGLKEVAKRALGCIMTCTVYYKNGDGKEYESPQEAFAALIDSINGKGTWNSNPFVFVYSFKLTKN